ncbi:MAG: amino acid ABC transporter permease [Cellvibrionaceae bacterium]
MNKLYFNKKFPVVLPVKTQYYHQPCSLLLSKWIASIPLRYFLVFCVLVFAVPSVSYAVENKDSINPFAVLMKWMPVLLTKGFLMNIIISFLTVFIGTVLGVFLGIGQISNVYIIRKFSAITTQVFRNSPWLVLLFIVMLSFPFEVEIGSLVIPIPDWFKGVIGLSLPLMANISEIVRGAIQSVPTGQWEASESLAFSRHQTLWRIVLPQTIKRMIPPWMNWYAIMTMATPLVSLLGVTEVVNLSRQAMEAENNDPALLVPFYGFCLVIFFLYTYPIARLTISLEKKFAVKL